MQTYTQLKRQILRDKEVKRAYEALRPEFTLVHMLIQRRLNRGLTQAELAKKIGTKQSAISRLESGQHNPTLGILRKIAEALDADLKISLHGNV